MVCATYAACAKFIRLCRDSDLSPIFLNVSFVGGNSLVEALGKTDARLIVTQVVPYPSGPYAFRSFANTRLILRILIRPLRRVLAISKDISPPGS